MINTAANMLFLIFRIACGPCRPLFESQKVSTSSAAVSTQSKQPTYLISSILVRALDNRLWINLPKAHWSVDRWPARSSKAFRLPRIPPIISPSISAFSISCDDKGIRVSYLVDVIPRVQDFDIPLNSDNATIMLSNPSAGSRDRTTSAYDVYPALKNSARSFIASAAITMRV